jgi:hypothetical protein
LILRLAKGELERIRKSLKAEFVETCSSTYTERDKLSEQMASGEKKLNDQLFEG